MSDSIDFQVTFNSQRRAVRLRLLSVGPRGAQKEIMELSRHEAQRLWSDLATALRIMDEFDKHAAAMQERDEQSATSDELDEDTRDTWDIVDEPCVELSESAYARELHEKQTSR